MALGARIKASSELSLLEVNTAYLVLLAKTAEPLSDLIVVWLEGEVSLSRLL